MCACVLHKGGPSLPSPHKDEARSPAGPPYEPGVRTYHLLLQSSGREGASFPTFPYLSGDGMGEGNEGEKEAIYSRLTAWALKRWIMSNRTYVRTRG